MTKKKPSDEYKYTFNLNVKITNQNVTLKGIDLILTNLYAENLASRYSGDYKNMVSLMTEDINEIASHKLHVDV